MINIPILLQNSDYDCGEAVVRSVLQYYGINTRLRFASEIDGSSPRSLEHQLRIQKLNVISGNFSIKLLDYYIKNNLPVISCFDGHWIVFCGKENRSYVYFDPEHEEYQKISGKKLKTIWEDFDSVGTKYINWGIVAYR